MNLADLHAIVDALLLLAAANGAPVLGRRLLGARFGFAIDGGLRFLDGRPLFGPSKTWRGLVLGIAAGTLVAPLLGLAAGDGACFAVLALAGDLLSSFIKRRLALPSSSQALGLDQIPESLLPLLGCGGALALTGADIALTVVLFVVFELLLSRLLYRLRIREQPY